MSASLCCVTPQKIEDSVYTAREDWAHAKRSYSQKPSVRWQHCRNNVLADEIILVLRNILCIIKNCNIIVFWGVILVFGLCCISSNMSSCFHLYQLLIKEHANNHCRWGDPFHMGKVAVYVANRSINAKFKIPLPHVLPWHVYFESQAVCQKVLDVYILAHTPEQYKPTNSLRTSTQYDTPAVLSCWLTQLQRNILLTECNSGTIQRLHTC